MLKHFIYIYINPHEISVITHILKLKKLELKTCSWTCAIFRFSSSFYSLPFFNHVSFGELPSFHKVKARQSAMNTSSLLPFWEVLRPKPGQPGSSLRLTRLFLQIWNEDNKRQCTILYLAYTHRVCVELLVAIFLGIKEETAHRLKSIHWEYQNQDI